MADVSLDDLIKKDKTKDKVNKLRQVTPLSPRNSKLKNSSVELGPSIIKTEVTEGQEILSPTSIDRSKSVSKIIVLTEGTTGIQETRRTSKKDVLSQLWRRRRKGRSSSAL